MRANLGGCARSLLPRGRLWALSLLLVLRLRVHAWILRGSLQSAPQIDLGGPLRWHRSAPCRGRCDERKAVANFRRNPRVALLAVTFQCQSVFSGYLLPSAISRLQTWAGSSRRPRIRSVNDACKPTLAWVLRLRARAWMSRGSLQNAPQTNPALCWHCSA